MLWGMHSALARSIPEACGLVGESEDARECKVSDVSVPSQEWREGANAQWERGACTL